MTDLETALAANRQAVGELLAAGDASGDAWAKPRAPGKWSPSQIVEHVARTLEESAVVIAGGPSKFPNVPKPLRPVVRAALFNRVLRNKAFPKARTGKAFDPLQGSPTPQDARVRVTEALSRFDHESRTRAAAGSSFTSTAFGAVSLADYAMFMAIHAQHHRRQLT
jgi:hypothetical protein